MIVHYYNEWDKGAAAWLRELINNKLIPYGYVDERSITEVTPSDLEGFTQCHFFAGIGGWPLALQLAGIPESTRLWTGSPPCQPFSVAGQSRGFDDERHLAPAFSGSSESASLNCYLESRLRQQLESIGSTLYSLTWRKKVTPAGRQYCQRAASVLRTKETDFSLVRARWPTPTTRDHKDGKECQNVPTNSLLGREVWKAGWPTPRARDNHTEGQGQHSPSLPRLVERVSPPEPIRIMASGQVLTGSDAGMEGSGQLNPAHSRWLMGFPPEWDACAVTAMQSSRKSQRNS